MRPDNSPAMNTMTMCDFGGPGDNKYGEADEVQVRILRGA